MSNRPLPIYGICQKNGRLIIFDEKNNKYICDTISKKQALVIEGIFKIETNRFRRPDW